MEREDIQHNKPDNIQSGMIQYSDVSTREVRYAPTPPVVDFSNSDIKVLYEDLGFSGVKIATIIGVTSAAVYKRLRAQGVEIRPSLSDPELEERRVSSIRKTFEKRGIEINAKIHTKESNAKRSETIKHKLKTDSALREKLRIAHEAKRSKSEENRKAKKMASEARMVKLNLARSHAILHSPWFLNLNTRHQAVLRLRYKQDGSNPVSFTEVGEIMGITKQRVHQLENKALAILKAFEGSNK